jgi:hypothetical protein
MRCDFKDEKNIAILLQFFGKNPKSQKYNFGLLQSPKRGRLKGN